MIIRIKNLKLRAIIGVNPWERVEKQMLIINAECEFDGSAVTASDDLEDTIDYGVLCQRLVDHAEKSHYQLIESLAGHLLNILMRDKRVTRARIEVDKPHALWSADAASVEVSAVRNKTKSAHR